MTFEIVDTLPARTRKSTFVPDETIVAMIEAAVANPGKHIVQKFEDKKDVTNRLVAIRRYVKRVEAPVVVGSVNLTVFVKSAD